MLSYADLIHLGGYAAIEYTGGPILNFRMGRPDATEEATSTALTSHSAIDQFSHTGLSKREIVALMGRRTLGFLPPEEEQAGRWCQNPYVFDNTYFQELLNEHSKYIKLEDDLSLLNDSEARLIV